MLIAKGVVDTLAIDPHVLHQILDRRSLVTARPENLHGFMEDFIAIELFLARHLCCRLCFYTLSGTNSQESTIRQARAKLRDTRFGNVAFDAFPIPTCFAYLRCLHFRTNEFFCRLHVITTIFRLVVSESIVQPRHSRLHPHASIEFVLACRAEKWWATLRHD